MRKKRATYGFGRGFVTPAGSAVQAERTRLVLRGQSRDGCTNFVKSGKTGSQEQRGELTSYWRHSWGAAWKRSSCHVARSTWPQRITAPKIEGKSGLVSFPSRRTFRGPLWQPPICAASTPLPCHLSCLVLPWWTRLESFWHPGPFLLIHHLLRSWLSRQLASCRLLPLLRSATLLRLRNGRRRCCS